MAPDREHDWEWLGEPLAVDYANSVRRRGMEVVDLWRDGAEVERWASHEQGRVPPLPAAAAARRLDDLRALRDDVIHLLHATVRGDALPEQASERINARARAEPVVPQLGARPGERSTQVVLAGDAVDVLVALVAASAIDVVGAGAASGLQFCDAPSCGQFFIQGRRNQRWCGPTCGTRARVARHARRAGRQPGAVPDRGDR